MSNEPIHRWYTSVMAFAPSFVRDALADLCCDLTGFLLDPFCGTGTTLVESKLIGTDTIGLDANPFSAFCSKAKTDWSIDSHELKSSFDRIISTSTGRDTDVLEQHKSYVPHAVKSGWVSPQIWNEARAIYSDLQQIDDPSHRQLLQLAVISAVKETCADIAFGPEIYKRKRTKQTDVEKAVSRKVNQIVEDLEMICAPRLRSKIEVFHGDARNLEFLARSGYAGRIKWVITSPPYPTEHDYSRISRIELELGGFVRSREDLRKIKRLQLRSNSKTVYADDKDWEYVKHLDSVASIVKRLEELAKGKTYGFAHRYPLVVANYFGGLYLHLSSLAHLMPPGGMCLYVLGEQRSYLGVLIPVPDIFIEIACEQLQAFRLMKRKVIRLRRGTKGTVSDIREEAIVLLRR
jgi:hypothetical protein